MGLIYLCVCVCVCVCRAPDIPANASITYELELLDVQPPVDYATVTEKELTTLV